MAGFKYVGSETGGDISGKVKTFAVDSTYASVVGIGDLVVVTGDADADGRSEVELASANTAATGVVTGIEPSFEGEALSRAYIPASTGGYVRVNTDPFALYECEVANGPLVVADCDLNAPAVVTAGTVSGSLFTSNMKVNDTGAATTATLPLTIVALKEDDDGTLGNKAIVRINKLGYVGIA